MRKRDALVEQTDLVQIVDDALREGLVGPDALIACFQKMHVHATAAARRCLANTAQHVVGAPLHSGRSVLNRNTIAFNIARHRLDHGDLLGRRQWWMQEALLDARACVRW